MDGFCWTYKIGHHCAEFFFTYETKRHLVMRNWKLSLIYKLVHVLLIAYLIGHVFLQTKSYQELDSANTSVVVKVKGTLQRKTSGGIVEVWDSSDFVVPAQESNAFSIATNMIDTMFQQQGHCAEDIYIDSGKSKIQCMQHEHCPVGETTKYGNGILTGNCTYRTGTCQIFGWCPTQSDETPKSTVLNGFDTISILVKNNIAFPKFNVKRRNILDSFDQNFLSHCRFHPVTSPICPIFYFVEILAFANQTLEAMVAKGGVIGFYIDWDCDLNYDVENCVPKYSFRRLDSREDRVAAGWDIRQAVYYYDRSRIIQRDLFKYWGVRFVMMVNGRAGRFSYDSFFMNLGSTISLFGIASFAAELILVCCDNSSALKDLKYEDLKKLRAKRRFSVALDLRPRGQSSWSSDSNLSRDLGSCICMDHRRRSSLPADLTVPNAPRVIYRQPHDNAGDLDIDRHIADERTWV